MASQGGTTPEHLHSPAISEQCAGLRSSRFRFKRRGLMYIPTKTPRKLDRKRSKLLRSKFKAKNRNRRNGLKK